MHSISILFLGMFICALSLFEFLIIVSGVYGIVALGYIPEPSGQVIGGIFISLNVITAVILLWVYFKNKSFQRVLLKILFWFSPLSDLIDDL